jgi:hypothetical protein
MVDVATANADTLAATAAAEAAAFPIPLQGTTS